MRTYNATAARLRLLADAIDAGRVYPENVRIQAEADAEMVIVHESEHEADNPQGVWCCDDHRRQHQRIR